MVTRALLAIVLAAAAGCAGSADGGGPDSCQTGMTFSPSMPLTNDVVRVSANLSVGGVFDYDWAVTRGGASVPFDIAQADGSAIDFTATTAGVYRIQLTPTNGPEYCPPEYANLTVTDSSANMVDVRLHVTPPVGVDAVPIGRRLRFQGGGDYAMGPVVLEPGLLASGSVQSGGAGVAAYLRFSPLGQPHAIVEAYADTNGAFTARVLDQLHEVLVIPTDPNLAPARLPWSPGADLVLTAGDTISGTVAHGGSPVENARVQLVIDGVPTTPATTSVTGAFSVRGRLVADRPVKVMVTPPTASGLPRLEAEGALDPSQPVTITYGATTLRDVGGATVRRGGTPAGNARVTIVGTRSNVGLVTTGGASLGAEGHTRVSVVASAGGVLPSALAPAWSLDAVVEVTPGDLAVSAFDLTTAVPASCDAPPMVSRVAGALYNGAPLGGVRLTLVPAGPLAQAGAPASEYLTADGDGNATAMLASGGLYDAVWTDPAGRAGQRVTPGVTAATITATTTLAPPLHITGTLSVTGSPSPVHGAAIQVRCGNCTGLAAERSIFETASDAFGAFDVTVADPAPM